VQKGHFLQVHDNPVASPVDAPTQWPLRNLRRLLEELIAVANASRGREECRIDLLPVGEEFDPAASV
jgi:2-dehydro-3-deoxyphosphooctonate aldolase (KDO 8-P synthase)